MANLSVRGVEEKSLRRLKETARRRGISVNRLIADVLNAEAGIFRSAKPLVEHDDLDKLAGTWSKQDSREFERAIASFEQIDKELWR